MRNFCHLLFILVIPMSVFGQIDTTYYNGNLEPVEKTDKFSFYRVVNFLEHYNWYDVNFYYLTGEVFITGKLISVAPEIKNGKFFTFAKNGSLLEEQVYSNNQLIYSKLHQEKSPLVQIKGKVYKLNEVVRVPVYPDGYDGFSRFLKENVVYPNFAKERGIQGRVYLNFKVTKEGEIHSVKVVKSVDPSLNNEAIRILEASSPWLPSTKNGVPVEVDFTFAINFRLN